MGEVVEFRPRPKDPKKDIGAPLSSNNLELIGFLTYDDRDIWVKDKKDIEKILKFIRESGIIVFEGE